MEKNNKKEFVSNKPDKTCNKVCDDCVFWKRFNKECYVHWESKKFCTMKVENDDQFEEVKDIYDINKL